MSFLKRGEKVRLTEKGERVLMRSRLHRSGVERSKTGVVVANSQGQVVRVRFDSAPETKGESYGCEFWERITQETDMKEFTITLPQDKEVDVVLELPNGQKITLQYRLEMPSIDVCLPEDLVVTTWKGDDLEPAPTIDDNPDRSHERVAKQLCIGLRPDHVDVDVIKLSNQTEKFSLFPNLTPERAATMKILADRKQHLEYLCYMMLNRLNKATDLKASLKHGMKDYGFSKDEQNELLNEFFGDRDKDEEAGCCEAEGHTIPSLLEEWQNTTEAMMRCLTPA